MTARIRRAAYFLRNFYAVPYLVPYWDRREADAVQRVLTSTARQRAEIVEAFEEAFARTLGARYAVATNLGRTAIEVGLRALGVGPGDEVVAPTFGCKGSVLPILRVGARLVLVDVGRDYNVDPESVSSALGASTRAVLVSHLSGARARIDEVARLAEPRDIHVIDDAAQATGVWWAGRALGTRGRFGVFSFAMGKNMMATAGGALVTDSPELARRARALALREESVPRTLGRALDRLLKFRMRAQTAPFFIARDLAIRRWPRKPVDDYPLGRMSALDAALCLCQLEKLPEIIRRRRANAQHLIGRLKGLGGLEVAKESEDHVFTKFLVRLSTSTGPWPPGPSEELLRFQRFLRHDRIETENTYTPLHLRPGFDACGSGPMPVAEEVYHGTVALPVQPHLGPAEMERVASRVEAFFDPERGAGDR